MVYLVKNNVFALGRLNKAGTIIEIDEKEEVYFKGHIEKIEIKNETEKATTNPKKKVVK